MRTIAQARNDRLFLLRGTEATLNRLHQETNIFEDDELQYLSEAYDLIRDTIFYMSIEDRREKYRKKKEKQL